MIGMAKECLPPRPPIPRIAGRGGKAEYLCDLNWGGPLPESCDEGKSRLDTHGGRKAMTLHWERIMGRTLGAGPSVGHPFLCETTTLRTLPVANSSEWTRTLSSCVAHSTKAALIVPEGVSLNTVFARIYEQFIGYLW